MNLVFPEFLNYRNFDSMIKSFKECRGRANKVDLSNIMFIFPEGLNMLLHLMEQLEEFNDIVFPTDNIMSYLIRMDFFKNLEETWELPENILYKIRLYDKGRDENNRTLVELTKLEEYTDVFEIVTKVDDQIKLILNDKLGYSSNDIDVFVNILTELCANISRHSQAHGYVSVQYVPYYESENFFYRWPLKIGITDYGVGFAKSYGNNITDQEGLKKAIIDNITSKERGGLGLKYIKNYVKEFGGELYIRSGKASYIQQGKIDSDIVTDLEEFGGSQIAVTLPNKKY